MTRSVAAGHASSNPFVPAKGFPDDLLDKPTEIKDTDGKDDT